MPKGNATPLTNDQIAQPAARRIERKMKKMWNPLSDMSVNSVTSAPNRIDPREKREQEQTGDKK